MEELISIVVPVYNVENYLNKCINSLLNQTYKKIEIILVDDGSTDKSSGICDGWKEKDNRIKVIHKSNEGLPKARKDGIESSKGNYILFVDSDDYIEKDLIENLYKSIIDDNVDIVISGHINESFLNKIEQYGKEKFIENSEQILKRMLTHNDISHSIWGNLYKRELFNDVKFPKENIAEDLAVIYQLIDKAEKISHINKIGYYYIQRGDSLMNKKYSKDYLNVIKVSEDIVNFVKEKYPNIIEYAECFWAEQINDCIILCYHKGFKKEYKTLKNELKQNMDKILKNSKIKLCIKFKYFFIAYFELSRIIKI